MRKIALSALIVFFLVSPLAVYAGGKWYQNGTLHRGSVAEWRRATHANKLATASDWVVNGSPKIKALVMRSGTVDTGKPFAEALVNCVNEAAAGQGYGNMGVAELAAGCMILMGW